MVTLVSGMLAGSAAKYVPFPHFRQYEKVREEANNAIMALLAGSSIALHTLTLTAGSQQLLPQIFPQVPYIRHFNLKTEVAASILKESGHHLAAVTLPYALAVHEDLIMTIIKELCVQRFGYLLNVQGGGQLKAFNMHETLYRTLGQPVPTPKATSLQLFHMIREVRNCQVHANGMVSPDLENKVKSLSTQAEQDWIELTGRTPTDLISASPIQFVINDIKAFWAIAKRVAYLMNDLLAASLTAEQWSEILVEDYSSDTSKPRFTDEWMFGCWRFATQFYGRTPVTESSIFDAAVNANLWKRTMPTYRPKKKAPRNRGTLYPEGPFPKKK